MRPYAEFLCDKVRFGAAVGHEVDRADIHRLLKPHQRDIAALGAADQLGVSASAVIAQRWREVRRGTAAGADPDGGGQARGVDETACATSESGVK